MPASVQTSKGDLGSAAPPAAIGPQADRPWVTSRDVAFLAYYYPLRWLVRMFGQRFLRVAQSCAEPASEILQAGDLRNATDQMTRILETPPGRAHQLGRHYLSNRVRAALFDLLPEAARLRAQGRIEGRQHLERALEPGRGAVLVTLHCLAKREARTALSRAAIDFHPVIHDEQRDFPGHGRLLWRFVRSRLLPLQWKTLRGHIVDTDPDAVMQIARVLRQGGLVLMASDVLYASTTHPLRFANTIWRISTGVLDIARLTGCALVPMWVSISGGECVVEFRPALALRSSGNDEEAQQLNRDVLVAALEEQLFTHPEQWEFWDRTNRIA